MNHIVLHQSDPPVVPGLAALLEIEGWSAVVVSDRSSVSEQVHCSGMRLVLLERTSADPINAETFRLARAERAVPLIVLSTDDSEDAIVNALDAGADAYVTQPVSTRELIARIRTILRRFQASEDAAGEVVRAGPVLLDLEKHTATVGSRVLDLPLREFVVLRVLVQNHGFIVTRDELFSAVGGSSFSDPRKISAYIGRLRSKIEPDPHQPAHIITLRGVGYKFAA